MRIKIEMDEVELRDFMVRAMAGVTLFPRLLRPSYWQYYFAACRVVRAFKKSGKGEYYIDYEMSIQKN